MTPYWWAISCFHPPHNSKLKECYSQNAYSHTPHVTPQLILIEKSTKSCSGDQYSQATISPTHLSTLWSSGDWPNVLPSVGG